MGDYMGCNIVFTSIFDTYPKSIVLAKF